MENQNIQVEDNSGDKKYFTIIPNYIANHSTANDQALYFQMKKRAGESGICFSSKKTLMQKLGIGRWAFDKSLKYLVDKKWISYAGEVFCETKGGIQKISSYRVNDIWKMNAEFYNKDIIEKEVEKPVMFMSETRGRQFSTPAKNNIKGGLNQTPNKNPVNNIPFNSTNVELTGVATPVFVGDRKTKNPIRQVVRYFFELKGKKPKKGEYARNTKSAKDLLELCDGDIGQAKRYLKIVADWADSRKLSWAIETVFKKFYEIEGLKPREKKPYYRGNLVFEIRGKKYILMPSGEKLEYAGKTSELEYK